MSLVKPHLQFITSKYICIFVSVFIVQQIVLTISRAWTGLKELKYQPFCYIKCYQMLYKFQVLFTDYLVNIEQFKY